MSLASPDTFGGQQCFLQPISMLGGFTPQSLTRVTTTRTRLLVAADLVVSVAATSLAFLAQFERLPLPAPYGDVLARYLFIVCATRIAVFFSTGAYSQAWRYASVREAVLLLYTGTISTLVTIAGGRVLALFIGTPVPWSVLLLDATLFMAGASCVRLLARAQRQSAFGRAKPTREGRRTLIVGAGSAGQLVARELTDSNRTGMVPFGFLDDDPSLHGKRILGLPVLGHTSDMVNIAKAASVDHLEFASPSDIAAIAASETIAVLLPAVSFYLGRERYADARTLIDSGAVVALAAGYNRLTAPGSNMQFAVFVNAELAQSGSSMNVMP